jgi:Cof subfamily protein (haloacid dehalogenase superfamily)
VPPGKPSAERGARLLALDLDGTLLRSDGSVSARTLAALAAVRAAGVTIVVVTARPPRRLRPIAQQAAIQGLALCGNGSILYDLDRDCVAEQTAIELEHAHALVTALRRVLPEVAFAIEAGARYGRESHYAIQAEHPHDALDEAMLCAEVLELCALGATKLIVQHPALSLPELLRIVREHAGALSVTHSGSNFVEVGPAGLTKAIALAALCERMGIDARDVIAFGDMPNDLPMLQWDGTGIAVANAHPDVLAAIEARTTSNDEDGVAVVLERLVTNRPWR